MGGYAGFDEQWILDHWRNYKYWSEMFEDYLKEHPDCDRPLKYFQCKCNELGISRRYTKEQDEWLKENYAELGLKEAFDQFCKHFKVTKGIEGFRTHINSLGIHCTKEQKKERQRANRNYDECPIGTVRHRGRQDFIKVAPGYKGWIPLSQYVVGSVPKGHFVLHLDRDNRNNEKDNLMVVSRQVAARMAGHDFWSEHPEINRTAIMCCELEQIIEDKKELK